MKKSLWKMDNTVGKDGNMLGPNAIKIVDRIYDDTKALAYVLEDRTIQWYDENGLVCIDQIMDRAMWTCIERGSGFVVIKGGCNDELGEGDMSTLLSSVTLADAIVSWHNAHDYVRNNAFETHGMPLPREAE